MIRTIQPEDRISRYRVVGPLGSGGMGEVYLAHDPTLERSVALKVLPLDLVRDEERVRRFVREAKSASSLNHPNIVTIYEIGHERVHAAGDDEPVSDPIHFISMELVTGETLGDKIRSQKTDLKTLLGYLAQAAEGIAKAHGAGIVHRDLKPSNIMISDDGYAKVLDFGLAKLLEREAVSEDLSAAATVSRQTTTEKALGTVGYMSPEQIRGSKVDHRSDIFSFGCVLYECVTRRRAFRADTDVETLHQILHQAPSPAEEVNPDAPRALLRLINRCLARNPERRLQSMKDLAIELQEIVDEYETLTPSSGSPVAVGSGGQPTVGGRRIPPVVLGFVALVGVVGLVLGINALLRGPDSKPADVSSPAHVRVTSILSDVAACALSPDGKYLAYTAGFGGGKGLWIRQLVTGSDVELSAAMGDETGNISFSPDGSYVYFGAPHPDDSGIWVVYRVPFLGGSPQRRLIDVDSRVSFSPDGRRACYRRGIPGDSMTTDLVIVDLDTGEESVLSTAAGFTFHSPAWSPSGARIVAIQEGRPDTLVVIDTATGDYEPLGGVWDQASSCVWLPEDRGVIVTASEAPGEASQIWRVTYPDGIARRITGDQDGYSDVTVTADGSALAARREVQPVNLWSAPVLGEPAPRRLTRSSAGAGGMDPAFRIVIDGSIVVPWDEQLRLLDGEGRQVRLVTSTPDMRSFGPRALPGGVLFERSALGDDVHHIWHVDLAGGAPRQLTSGPGEHILSRSVSQDVFLFRRKPTELFIGSVEGREPRQIPGSSPCGISPDGRWVFTTMDADTGRRVVVRPMDTLEPQLEFDLARRSSLVWTPGSDAIAQVMTAGESEEIVLQPLDGGEPRSLLEISAHRLDTRPRFGDPPYRWSPDGKDLCLKFWEGEVSNLWVVPSAGGELRPITDFRTGLIYTWEWAPDGQSVYFTRGDPEHAAVLIHDFE